MSPHQASSKPRRPIRESGADRPTGEPRPAIDESADTGAPLVDWERAGHRLLRTARWLAAAVLAGWIVWSLVSGGWNLRLFGNLVGLALAGMFLVEVWVAGGSALRGMLRAGERGERLAGSDVGLLPPQLRPGGRFRHGPSGDSDQDADPGGDGAGSDRDHAGGSDPRG